MICSLSRHSRQDTIDVNRRLLEWFERYLRCAMSHAKRLARIVSTAVLALLLLAPVPQAVGSRMQAGRPPLSLDDIMRLRTIQDPQIAPDGSRVAYVVSTPDFEENVYDTDIWLVSSDGGNLRNTGKAHDGLVTRSEWRPRLPPLPDAHLRARWPRVAVLALLPPQHHHSHVNFASARCGRHDRAARFLTAPGRGSLEDAVHLWLHTGTGKDEMNSLLRRGANAGNGNET